VGFTAGGTVSRQGLVVSEEDIKNTINLLKTTEMSISDVAERMGWSRSMVVSINRRYVVRFYNGRRAQWTIDEKAS
jgi:hypothetical protein